MVEQFDVATGVFVSMFWVAYFLSPRFCHRFVGYLEEEAVKTYTHCLEVRAHVCARVCVYVYVMC